MNIQNRLGKLERASNIDSTFCSCSSGIVTRVIDADLDRTETERETLIAEAQKPEYCDQCGKLIEKQLIIIQAVNGNDRPIEQTPRATNATFDICRSGKSKG